MKKTKTAGKPAKSASKQYKGKSSGAKVVSIKSKSGRSSSGKKKY